MKCAIHPDVAAMGTCHTCGRPVCSLCVHFRAGQLCCPAHGTPPAPRATPAAVPEPPIAGEPTAPPAIGDDPPRAPAPLWAQDPRLEPLPMSLRPGWTEEPLQPRRSDLADTLGLIGLIGSLIGLPFSFCCGVGGVVGAGLALITGGLCVAALVLAPQARNPTSARWLGGLGLGLSVLTLSLSLCFLVVTMGALGTSLFSVTTP
ncbi:MAG TPA: hypothetical protein VKY74_13315 [Chloroflexia bacterium]|nr:hypothetical protein [Chloroflexia bacterium]